MIKKKKLLVIGFLILVVCVCCAYIISITSTKEPSELNDAQLYRQADQAFIEQDIQVIIPIYSELLNNRDGKSIIQRYNSDAQNIEDTYEFFQAIYFVALLCAQNDIQAKDTYTSHVLSVDLNSYERFLQSVFLVINKFTKNDDTLYSSIFEKLQSYDWLHLEQEDKENEFLSFLYFYSASIKNNDTISNEIYYKLKERFPDQEFDNFFESDRLYYTFVLLSEDNLSDYSERFSRLFLESFGNGKPFTGMDISYIIASLDFQNEQLTYIYQSLDDLERNTELTDYVKISTIHGLKELIELEINSTSQSGDG